jgi:hypothetical protein
VSLRGNRLSDVWSLAGALTSHLVLHFSRFSETFRGERDREGRARSIFSAMNPGFPEPAKSGVWLYFSAEFLDKFFLPFYLLHPV